MKHSEQRRQILDALEFLRMLNTISGPPPGVFEALRDLLGRYRLDPGPLTELEQLVTIIVQRGEPRQQIIIKLEPGRGISYYTRLVFEIIALGRVGISGPLCWWGPYD